MTRHRSRGEQATLDIAASAVVAGITALIMQVANAMQYMGKPDAWVPEMIACLLIAANVIWLLWRLSEYD